MRFSLLLTLSFTACLVLGAVLLYSNDIIPRMSSIGIAFDYIFVGCIILMATGIFHLIVRCTEDRCRGVPPDDFYSYMI